MSDSLEARQQERYSRQLMMELLDEADQRTLLSSRVLVAGAGGLGSPVIQYLAAAGVGTLGIVDGGTVKRSNLHRQVIHTLDDIGTSKVDSAAAFVEALNSDVTVEKHPYTATSSDVGPLVEEYDVVVDGLDNFQSRFLFNDASRFAAIPFVHGAVYDFEGQAMTFVPDGPCYRCLLPDAPDSETIVSGEAMSIFPPAPGVIGCLQASETLKYLIEIGELLDDRLLRFDAMSVTCMEMPVSKDSDCPICGSDGIESIESMEYDL